MMSYHIISYHIISYHIISYHILRLRLPFPLLYSLHIPLYMTISKTPLLSTPFFFSSSLHFTYITYLSNGPNLESLQQLTVWLLIYEFEIHFAERACVIFLLLVSILSRKVEVNAERRR